MRLLLLLLVGGCAFSEDRIVSTLSDELCDRMLECSKGDFERTYDDMEQCRAAYEDFWQPFADCAIEEACEYDAEEARACHDAIHTTSCDDYVSGNWNGDCGGIYTCEDDLAYGLCLLGG